MSVNPGRSFIGMHTDVKETENIPAIKDCNRGFITDPVDKANLLNNYYASVFSCERYIPDINSTHSDKLFTIKISVIRKRLVRRLFNKHRSGKNPHSWDLYREAQRKYRKEVRKACKNARRTFCSSINDLPRSARLHRALSRETKIKLESLVAPSGRRTQSEGETLELLLTTHFPNSGVTQELAAPAAALLARRPDWRLATKVVTYRRVEWAIDSFAPYKSPGVDGIFSALLQQAREVVIPYLVRIFRACLTTMFQPCGDRLR
jgi:hypothetical protein